MGTYALFALYALAVCALVCWLFQQLWDQHEHQIIQEKWRERERLLDRRTTRALGHEILKRRARPAAPDSQRRPQIGKAETAARVLFVVAREQRELVEFLHKDFAAEEAEGVIEILMDRRQSPPWWGAQPPEVDGRRDPRRNRIVSANLREMGCALVRQPPPLPRAVAVGHALAPVTLSR